MIDQTDAEYMTAEHEFTPKYKINQQVYTPDMTNPLCFQTVKIYRIQIDLSGVTYQTDMTACNGKEKPWTYEREDRFFSKPREAVQWLLDFHNNELLQEQERHLKFRDREREAINKLQQVLNRMPL